MPEIGLLGSMSGKWKRKLWSGYLGTGHRKDRQQISQTPNATAPLLDSTKIGYRKLTGMMVDAGVACVGESTVYRVLRPGGHPNSSTSGHLKLLHLTS